MEVSNKQNNINNDLNYNINMNTVNNPNEKNSNNNNIETDNNNIKLLPLEISKGKRSSEGSNCQDVDILEYNNSPLITLKQVIKNPTLNSEQEGQSSFIYCYKDIPLNVLRVITIISIGLYMIVGIIGVIFFAKNREERPFLFCFNFISRDPHNDYGNNMEIYERIIFSSDLNSFCIIHFVLLFLLIFLLITLIFNKDNNGKSFLKDFSIFFPLTLVFNIPIFIMGIFSSKNGDEFWNSILYIFFTLLSALCMLKIYIGTKQNKYKNLIRVVNQGFLSGLLSAFELYTLIYNICYLSTWWSESNVVKMEIIPGVIYFLISLLTIILYNDLFFPSTALIIQIGLLYIKKSDSFSVVIFNVVVVFFSYISIISMILKQNKNVFNIIIEGESKKEK